MPSKKKVYFSLLALVLFIFSLFLPAFSQSLDEQLQWNDYQVAQNFQFFYPRDARYDQVMNAIAQRLNSSIVDTFGEDKDITFYVCVGPLGFNAISFHRFIVFDSLLLDTLRFLAMGVVYYGGLDNAYVNHLAEVVAIKSRYHASGYNTANLYNTENPFNLPYPGPLTEEQQERAKKLFISMLASWMAHEGSHCMLDHMKYRLQAMQRNNNMGGGLNQFNQRMSIYANAKLTRQLERQADEYATRWLINSGFGIEGFITWLKFGSKLEKLMGTENVYLRTHPTCEDRIKDIIKTAREYQKEGYTP